MHNIIVKTICGTAYVIGYVKEYVCGYIKGFVDGVKKALR